MNRTLLSRRAAVRLVVCSVVLAWASGAAAQVFTTPDELCTGDPCIINGRTDVINGSVIDFGQRAVVLRGTLDVGPGLMRILAGSFEISDGGQILGVGAGFDSGAEVSISTTGDILFANTASSPVVKLNGCDGGILELSSSEGDVTSRPLVRLNRTALGPCDVDGFGGELIVLDGGQVKIDDLIAVGGKDGAGGTLEVDARGDVVLDSIDLSGGDGDGSLLVLTDGNVTLANIFADGGGIDGAGGSIEVAADGDVSVTGPIKARGGDGLNNGGDGGVLEIISGPIAQPSGRVQILGDIILKGRGRFGAGGLFAVAGGDVVIAADVAVDAGGAESFGGELAIEATDFQLTGRLLADAADGPLVTILASNSIDLQGLVDADATAAAGAGGFVQIRGATVNLADAVTASARNGAVLGGTIEVEGCNVAVSPSSLLEAARDEGRLSVASTGPMTLAGSFVAGPDLARIDVIYRDPAQPPNLIGSSFSPQPAVVNNPLLALPCPEPGAALQAAAVLLGLSALGRRRRRG